MGLGIGKALKNIGSGIGSAINKITGAESSSAKTQKYALQSAQVNNEYQKEFAKNAHQWEVEDLEKAGLNPILSAGGSGTGASGGGVDSATQTTGGISPLDFINTIVNARNTEANTGKTNKEIEEASERIANHRADRKLTQINSKIAEIELLLKTKTNPTIVKQEEQRLQNLIAEYDSINANTGKTVEEIKKAQGGTMAKTLGTEPIKYISTKLDQRQERKTKNELKNFRNKLHKDAKEHPENYIIKNGRYILRRK